MKAPWILENLNYFFALSLSWEHWDYLLYAIDSKRLEEDAINIIGSTIYSTFLFHNLILEKQSLIPEFQMQLLQPTHNFKQNKYGYFDPLLFLFQ